MLPHCSVRHILSDVSAALRVHTPSVAVYIRCSASLISRSVFGGVLCCCPSCQPTTSPGLAVSCSLPAPAVALVRKWPGSTLHGASTSSSWLAVRQSCRKSYVHKRRCNVVAASVRALSSPNILVCACACTIQGDQCREAGAAGVLEQQADFSSLPDIVRVLNQLSPRS